MTGRSLAIASSTRRTTLAAADVDRDDRAREQHGVAQRKDREMLRNLDGALGAAFCGGGHASIVYASGSIRQSPGAA